MIRLGLLLLAGLLLGGVVHFATVIVLPRTATQDAYARLTPLTPVNAVTPLPAPSSGQMLMPLDMIRAPIPTSAAQAGTRSEMKARDSANARPNTSKCAMRSRSWSARLLISGWRPGV